MQLKSEMAVRAAACTIGVLLCIHSSHAATLLNTVVNINGNSYQQEATLPAVRSLLYPEFHCVHPGATLTALIFSSAAAAAAAQISPASKPQ